MTEPGVPTCPVCKGECMLRALDPQLGFRVPLRRCDRCHGIWADAEAVRVARKHYHETHYVMTRGHGRQACRHCGAVLPKPSVACRKCLGDQTLRCPSCTRRMTVVGVEGVAIDVCKPCRSVWFDRGELGLIARAHADELYRRVNERAVPAPQGRPHTGLSDGSFGGGAIDTIDALQFAPDTVWLVAQGAHAAGDLALRGVELAATQAGAATELVAAAGKGALEAGAAGAELASGTAEALLDVLAGLFDGL
jgi:Zn-finger nucleic acid-binding protein